MTDTIHTPAIAGLGRRQVLTGMTVAFAASACAESAGSQDTHQTSEPDLPSGTALSRQDLEDALTGSSYLGCGGGGSLGAARTLIREDLDAGLTFSLIDVSDLRDTDRVACPYGLASLAPVSPDMQARMDAITDRVESPVQESFSLLERHLDTKFAGVILGELGPLSMAEGLSIAARLGVPALDADTVGRATPEINQHSVRVAGHPLTPASGVTPFGDEIILEGLRDPSRAEDIFRSISVVSREVGVTDSPITGAVAKQPGTLVTKSFTLARNIGAAVRTAKASGTDPIDAARIAGDGYRLFTGSVKTYDYEDSDGFLVGTLVITGAGAFAGETMTLLIKNEHLVAERNGKTVATCPDLITVIDNTTFDGINNPDFSLGMQVTVLGFRSDRIWRTPAGQTVFSPRYFGYDLDYIPIETRLADL